MVNEMETQVVPYGYEFPNDEEVTEEEKERRRRLWEEELERGFQEPSYERGEFTQPDEEVIAGEFREVPDTGLTDEEKAEIWRLRADVEGQKGRTELAKLREEERKLKPSKLKTGVKAVEAFRKVVGGGPKVIRMGTPGGAGVRRGRLDLYVGRKPASAYVPTGMQRLSSPRTQKRDSGMYDVSGMRQLTTPSSGTSKLRDLTTGGGRSRPMDLSRLRGATDPSGYGQSPLSRVIAPSRRLASGGYDASVQQRMRQLGYPKGLTETERMAYAEIKANGDVDTKQHVVSELVKLGAPRLAASRAVDGLLRKGVVKADRTFRDEPVLEVAR